MHVFEEGRVVSNGGILGRGKGQGRREMEMDLLVVSHSIVHSHCKAWVGDFADWDVFVGAAGFAEVTE